MEPRLTKRLADNAANDKTNNAKFNLSVFILLKDEIYEAIDDGWSIKYIWKLLYSEEKVKFSYQTFLNFVNKHKNDKPKKLRSNNSNNELNKLPKPELEQKEKLKSDSSHKSVMATKDSKDSDRGSPKGFVWDPIPNPDDLF